MARVNGKGEQNANFDLLHRFLTCMILCISFTRCWWIQYGIIIIVVSFTNRYNLICLFLWKSLSPKWTSVSKWLGGRGVKTTLKGRLGLSFGCYCFRYVGVWAVILTNAVFYSVTQQLTKLYAVIDCIVLTQFHCIPGASYTDN